MRPARLTLCTIAAATLLAGLSPVSGALAAPITRSAATAATPLSRPASPVAGVETASDDVRPVRPSVRSVLVRASRHTVAAVSDSGQVPAALTGAEPVTGVAVAGVTWSGQAPPGLTMSVRTRSDGQWSGWTELEYDEEHGPSAGSAEADLAHPGSDPIVLGTVDDVQLRVESDTNRLPRDMELELIDPGATVGTPTADPASTSGDTLLARSAATTSMAGTEPLVNIGATPKPMIYSRADWGADERLTDCCVEYGEVHAGFVHHTVNANDYTRAETPAVLRGIYAYHTQSRGWRDIGYNFLIDKFGRIWEGRAGGISLPVIGAHTLNYNEYAFAASAVGNFETAHPSSSMVDAYARLMAWKLSLHGVRPGSRQLVGGTVFNAINGHRDAAQTACPGRYLYAKVPTIISKAKTYQRGFAGRDIHHSFLQDPRPDALLLDRSGALFSARGTGAPGFAPRSIAATGFGGHDQVFSVQDVTGDGLHDLMARRADSGVTSVHPGVAGGTFGAATMSTGRWSGMDLMAGPGDLNGDQKMDLVTRDATSGALLFYPGRGDGTFGLARTAIESLGGATAIAAGGDFNRDGPRDLLVLDGAERLVLRPGNGTGAFGTPVVLARNWGGHDLVTGGYDASGDALPDVIARNAANRTIRIYVNIGGTRLSSPVGGMSPGVRMMSMTRDVTGDRKYDLIGVNARGKVLVFAGLQQNWLAPRRSQRLTWAGMD
ncbi:MAG: FG-GAP-like repeat-containing protein, partial [Nocardioidaceae bacterium]